MKLLAIVASTSLALALGVATIAAPAQQARPGGVDQPRVIVENRGREAAIPVSIEAWDTTARPLNVVVGALPTVQARLLSQQWSYRTVKVAVNQDMATALSTPGVEGWEATGVQVTDPTGTTILLKRPR